MHRDRKGHDEREPRAHGEQGGDRGPRPQVSRQGEGCDDGRASDVEPWIPDESRASQDGRESRARCLATSDGSSQEPSPSIRVYQRGEDRGCRDPYGHKPRCVPAIVRKDGP